MVVYKNICPSLFSILVSYFVSSGNTNQTLSIAEERDQRNFEDLSLQFHPLKWRKPFWLMKQQLASRILPCALWEYTSLHFMMWNVQQLRHRQRVLQRFSCQKPFFMHFVCTSWLEIVHMPVMYLTKLAASILLCNEQIAWTNCLSPLKKSRTSRVQRQMQIGRLYQYRSAQHLVGPNFSLLLAR